MKIVVLCGGLSTERKISLSSGSRICTALRSLGHKAVMVDLFLGLEDLDEKYQSQLSEYRKAFEKQTGKAVIARTYHIDA